MERQEARQEVALGWPDKRTHVELAECIALPLFASGRGAESRQAEFLLGDNLHALTHLWATQQRFRVIYLDPPFDSARVYRNKVRPRGAAGRPAFERVEYRDRWQLPAYLQFMRDRLVVLRELLTDDGTLYLHCDTHRSHHLRQLCDEVFGASNFRNEITWCYTGPSNTGRDFPRKHDVILRYTRSSRYFFNKDEIRVPYRKLETGATKGIFQQAATLSEAGKVPEDWWADITTVGRLHKSEELLYPTQKPLQLLERMILASSQPGDTVLDPFSGSASTLVAALRAGRRAVGCDENPGALFAALRRLTQAGAESFTAYHVLACAPGGAATARSALVETSRATGESASLSAQAEHAMTTLALPEATAPLLQKRPGERASGAAGTHAGELRCTHTPGSLRIEGLTLVALHEALKLPAEAPWQACCAALFVFAAKGGRDGSPRLLAASVPEARQWVRSELHWDAREGEAALLMAIDVANDAHIFPLSSEGSHSALAT